MATINVSGNNMSTFDAGTEHTGQAYVGTTYEGNYDHKVTCRYKFTTDAYGATSVTFKTASATLGVGSNTDNIGRLYFDITDSATKYMTYKGNDYGTKITSYSYGNYVQGTLSIQLMPNTTYYVWIWPASNFSSYTRLNLGTCTVTTAGSYGTASTITASNGTMGSAINITLSNSVSGVKNTLKVYYGSTLKETLLTDSTSTSFSWTPATATYAPLNTTGKTVQVTLKCTTKYGSTTWPGESTKTITLTIPDNQSTRPIIDENDTFISAVNTGALSGETFYVQNFSSVEASISASAQLGASISTYSITVDGTTASGNSSTVTSGILSSHGSLTATLKVTDSRGFTVSTTRDLTVVQYYPPSLQSVSVFRCDDNGAKAEDGDEYSAFAIAYIAPVGTWNSYTMKAEHKSAGGAYGNEITLSSGQTYVTSLNLSPNVTYTAKITLTDRLGQSDSKEIKLPGQSWAMKFNGTGTAVAFGKAPEAGSNTLEIPYNWQIVRQNQAATETSRALFSDDFVDLIYPVGSIYMSVNSADPSTLFGGTWQRITGRFLLAATDGGSSGASQAPGNTGGASTHTLSANELPQITGQIGAYAGNTGTSAGGYGAFRSASGAFSAANIYQYARAQSGSAEGWPSGNAYGTINMSFGGGAAHNNMPPYLAVYVWKRTA